MAAGTSIQVKGLAELNRAFARVSRDLTRDMRRELRAAAEPVRGDAVALAASEIRNMHGGDPWDRMRIGVTSKVVYVAPSQRGVRFGDPRARPNLAGLLMDRAMQPALDRHRDEVTRRVEQLIERLAASNGF